MADTFEIAEDTDAGHGDHHMVHESTGIDNRKLGMWVFLSSEFLFFGAFISNYLLYGGRDFGSVVPRDIYDIPFTSISSFVLLMSSLTMVLAHHALSTGDQSGTKTWLMATALLGSVFLGGQVFEFTDNGRQLRIETDLLMRLTQGGFDRRFAAIDSTTGKADLAPVGRHLHRSTREQHFGTCGAVGEEQQDGGELGVGKGRDHGARTLWDASDEFVDGPLGVGRPGRVEVLAVGRRSRDVLSTTGPPRFGHRLVLIRQG